MAISITSSLARTPSMASVCISDCIDDTCIVPVRQTYVNLHRWPESDAEFVRTVTSKPNEKGFHERPRVVDSISCRQMFLRSYTFSRKETVPERTQKCLGKVRRGAVTRRREKIGGRRKRRCLTIVRAAKHVSCAALLLIFRRLLCCVAKVDVVDHHKQL